MELAERIAGRTAELTAGTGIRGGQGRVSVSWV
jgi:hypothetical protein